MSRLGVPRTWDPRPRLTEPDAVMAALLRGIEIDREYCPYSAAGDMPDIVLEHEDGEPIAIETCFRCKKQGLYDFNSSGMDGGIRERTPIWDAAFYCRRGHEWRMENFCDECAKILPRFIIQFLDIAELTTQTNFLQKAIYGYLKNQDNGATAANAGDGCARSDEWRSGYREGYRAAQAGEEHQRISLLGNEDCDVSQRGRRRTGKVR